jgi:murein L,D-transpeptidase YcbB/YkuD
MEYYMKKSKAEIKYYNEAFSRIVILTGVIALGLLLVTIAQEVSAEYGPVENDYHVDEQEQPPKPEYELIVNRNSFMMDVIKDGEQIDAKRVIVGRPGRTTPTLETEFVHMRINPTWNVPVSITDDMIRKFKGKPDPIAYIKRNKYYFVGKDGNRIPPESFDWKTISDKGPYDFQLKQEPGPLNMLGPVMFVLKDTGGIQMHGTANPELFENDVRKFSSGCIRVDGAVEVAANLLGKTVDEFEIFRNEVGSKWITLDQPVKVKVID